jgi:lipopolysaccharide transport system permease protein
MTTLAHGIDDRTPDTSETGGVHDEGGIECGPVHEISPAPRTWPAMLKSLWSRREIVAYLAWREIRGRYSQTLLGTFWTFVQPFAATLVYAIVFGKMVKLRADGVPYPLFVMVGVLAWQFLANSIQRSSSSLVANSFIIKKAYFPRLAIPLAAVATAFIEFGAACVVLVGMMAYYGVTPCASMLLLPILVAIGGALGLGLGLLLASVNCRFRDVQHGIGFGLQMWMFLTPVVYPLSAVPSRYHGWLQINPMTGLISGFRTALLGSPLDSVALTNSLVFAVLFLAAGGVMFRRVERTAADVL